MTLTIHGKAVLSAADLEAQAEAQLAYTLDFGYVARAGSAAVKCWFARKSGEKFDVDEKLWCGPVQVPGTAPSPDWVPVPLKEVTKTAEGVKFEVQPPQVPQSGARSTPASKLVRTDGTELDPAKPDEPVAGPEFLAVLPDDEKKTNAELGLGDLDVRLRDDLLAVRGTGWANPDTWPTPDGVLRASPGNRLRVMRLHVEKLFATDSGFRSTNWHGWAPQPSELALEVPGKRHQLPQDRLPDNGSVLVVYTVPDSGEAERLVIGSVGVKSLEQRMEIPSGKRVGDAPKALLRAGGATTSMPTQKIKIGSTEFGMKVNGVRLGVRRPVKTNELAMYDMVSASAPDKALLEILLTTSGGEPDSAAAYATKDLITVTLPGGATAPQVGVRYDGGVLPTAIVVEVPADVRSVSLGLKEGSLDLPRLGKVDLKALEAPVSIPLDF
ncbi:hypothetical protein Lesp02_79530 [Lentzea sp. NBRC 105346]|nr:hypothetical protein Lesp02_79530 [Lentzea sp. NBRC 105346]